jgi:hypothetical protein
MAKLASDGAVAVFRRAMAPKGTPVTVTVGGATWELPGTGPDNRANIDAWTKALWLATIAGDQRGREFLVSMPVELVQRAPGVEASVYSFLWMKALQAIMVGDVDRGQEYLEETLKATDPTTHAVLDPAHGRGPMSHNVMVMGGILSQDLATLDKWMTAALEAHRTYYTKDDPESANRGVALCPIELNGLAAFADGQGVALSVTSDYLLPALWRRADAR